jgi:hypothetical protein
LDHLDHIGSGAGSNESNAGRDGGYGEGSYRQSGVGGRVCGDGSGDGSDGRSDGESGDGSGDGSDCSIRCGNGDGSSNSLDRLTGHHEYFEVVWIVVLEAGVVVFSGRSWQR